MSHEGSVRRRGKMIGWLVVGLCGLCIVALSKNVLVGSTIVWHSAKNIRAERIVNTVMRRCAYLYPSGVVEREAMGEGEEAFCTVFGSTGHRRSSRSTERPGKSGVGT